MSYITEDGAPRVRFANPTPVWRLDPRLDHGNRWRNQLDDASANQVKAPDCCAHGTELRLTAVKKLYWTLRFRGQMTRERRSHSRQTGLLARVGTVDNNHRI